MEQGDIHLSLNGVKKKQHAVGPKSLANLRPIKKGEVRNPNGGRAHNPLRQALRQLTNKEYCQAIELALTRDIKALEVIMKDPGTSAMQLGIISCLHDAIVKKNWAVLNSIAERLVGRPPDEIKITSNNVTQVSVIDQRKFKEARDKILNDV